MRGLNSPAAGYLLTCGLVAASLVLATVADSKLGASPYSLPAARTAPAGNGPSASLEAAVAKEAARHWRNAPATEPTTEPVALAGVMVGRTMATRLALVAVNGGPAVLARPGDTLAGGYQVLAVDDASLTYLAGNRQVRVRLQAGAVEPPARPAWTGPANPGTATPEPTEQITAANGNEAFRQAVEQRLASLRH